MINTCHGPFQIECSIWKPRIQDYEKMMSWTSSSLKPTCKSRYASTPKSHSHIKHLCKSNIQNDVAHFVADKSRNIDTIILQISLKKHLLNLSGENAMENESVMHFTERRTSPAHCSNGDKDRWIKHLGYIYQRGDLSSSYTYMVSPTTHCLGWCGELLNSAAYATQATFIHRLTHN